MDRRAFIAGTAGGLLAAGPLAASAAAAEAGGRGRIATYVTGLRDHGGRTGVPVPGSLVTLLRVRDRDYDPFSIGVIAEDGRLLGFLPPAHGQVLAPLMDAGLRLGATVSDGAMGRDPRLNLELELLGLSDQS